jgi:hypothetical protein
MASEVNPGRTEMQSGWQVATTEKAFLFAWLHFGRSPIPSSKNWNLQFAMIASTLSFSPA